MKTEEITNGDNVIDTRDITERLKELEAMRADPDHCDDYEATLDEYTTLEAFASDIGEYAFENEDALINEHYFEDYARELAVDIGAIDSDTKWPCYCIDWKRAAKKLLLDYTSAEFGGVTYYVRC